MSALYRKKPIPVEARQLLGSEDGQTGRDLAEWCGGSAGGRFVEPMVLVPTLEGDLMARDWIVKGPRGEFWPVKGSIFAETYEGADAPLHAACRSQFLNEAASVADSCVALYEGSDEAAAAAGAMEGLADRFRRMAGGKAPDARQAARDEAADWLASYPFPADTTGWAHGRSEGVAWAVSILRNPNPTKPEAEPSGQPEFFQIGRTYARKHHAATIRFLVRSIDAAPDGTYRVAFGWRVEDGDYGFTPFDSDDMDGWTDVTEAGGDRG